MDLILFLAMILLPFALYLIRVILRLPFLTLVGSIWILLFGVWFIFSGELIAVRYELVDNSLNTSQSHEWVWQKVEVELPLIPYSMITLIVVALGIATVDMWGSVVKA